MKGKARYFQVGMISNNVVFQNMCLFDFLSTSAKDHDPGFTEGQNTWLTF